MEIELRKIKHAHHLSRDTSAFTALLFIDNMEVASVENDGGGGMNNIHPYGQSMRKYIDQAEEYAKTLPAVDGGQGFMLPMCLDFFLSLQVDADISQKETQRILKSFDKKSLKSIIVIDKDIIKSLLEGKIPSSQMEYRTFSSPPHQEKIKENEQIYVPLCWKKV